MSEWLGLGLGLALVVAAGLAFAWRQALDRGRALESEKGRLESERAELETALARDRKVRKQQADELSTFRKRADKARKRSERKTPPPLGTASRIQDLEEGLALATSERDRFRAEHEAMAAELSRLRGQIDEAAAKKAEVAVAARAHSESEELSEARSGLGAMREQLSKLEGELAGARQGEARLRKRLDTQEQLYASLRAELEVKKDRLRTQAEQLERLQALKVALTDD